MVKLNALQYQNTHTPTLDESYSVEPLKNNSEFERITTSFKKEYKHKSLNTFSFTKEGFLSLFFQLNGSIAISLGECEAIVQAGKMYEKLGHTVTWISLNSEGEIKYQACKDLKVDFFFVSSYVMDTFMQTSLEKIKENSAAKIISNCSANKYAKNADLILFDAYKLSGYGVCGVILYSDDELEEQYDGETDVLGLKLIHQALEKQKFVISNKDEFIEVLKDEFKENLHFFVDANLTLPYTL
ncbi:MAG: cysteine desulfurase, partial [Campylobacteraceae bacterium]|nr:cysteine desulfurase [Campylobacteraceae bacterium]